MVNDGPNCLAGPVSRMSPWWTACKAGSSPCTTEQVEASRQQRPIRHELVERVRREIAAGTYETPEKWEAALDRLFGFLEQK